MKYGFLCQQFETDWVGIRTDLTVAFARDNVLNIDIDKKRILVTINEEWTPTHPIGILSVYKNVYLPFYYKDKRIDLI